MAMQSTPPTPPRAGMAAILLNLIHTTKASLSALPPRAGMAAGLLNRFDRSDKVGIFMALGGWLLFVATSILVDAVGYQRGLGIKSEFAWLYWPIMLLARISFISGIIAFCGIVVLAFGKPRRREALLYSWGWGRLRLNVDNSSFDMVWVNALGIGALVSAFAIEAVGKFILDTVWEFRAAVTGDLGGRYESVLVWSLYFYDWSLYLHWLGIAILAGGFLRSRSGGADESRFLAYIGVILVLGGIVWWLFQVLQAMFVPSGDSWMWVWPAVLIAIGVFLFILAAIPLDRR